MRAHDNATLKYSCWFILQATDGDQGNLVRRIVFLPNNIGEPAQARGLLTGSASMKLVYSGV